jgi:hypothetical protein
LPSRCESRIYDVLSSGSATLGEVSRKFRVDYRTAKDMLMHLPLTSRYVRYKASGRIHVF